ncbi:Fibronectin type-III domain-containing protein 3A [Hondaea fermentalgiana]|uniref:Fibronectin type-III domain-containing protein 3A n=1 Tax=Hondaea fermentalgiana TaxID=2315210 RepID=A0A2R5GV16_9STRA|nr:Fibronectin type-III domain-containing protein 3A [Hondaea fermentalgiana]|eukprot:GBG34702.1 Fibronectin type-III domain-containing protein 3A [Hondaea fermentalgiana]
MAPPRMARPEATNPTEFSVDIKWQKVDGATSYKLYRRKIPDTWETAKVTTIGGSETKVTLEDLEPTSTYQFRIAAVTSEGEGAQSEDLTIDTAVANCTPKKKCVIS